MIQQISCQQRIKEISEIFRFWRRIRKSDFYYSDSNFQCENRLPLSNSRWQMLQCLYEFSLLKAYGEDISNQFENQLLDSIYNSVGVPRGNLECRSEIPLGSLLNGALFLPAQILYPDVFRQKIDHYLSQLIKGNFPRENIDTKSSSFIRQHIFVTDDFLVNMDDCIGHFKERLDACFKYSKSLKFISLNLLYVDPKPSFVLGLSIESLQHARERCEKHLQKFLKKLDHVDGLLTNFNKIEYGVNSTFNVFGIFIFKNKDHITLSMMASQIQKVWYSTFNELTDYERNSSYPGQITITHPYVQRVENHQWSNLVTEGMLRKDSARYTNFVRFTLNYMANQTNLFKVMVAGKELPGGNAHYYPDPKNELIPFNTKSFKTKRKVVKKPKSSTINFFSTIAKKFTLTQMVKKKLEEIETCYGFLANDLQRTYPADFANESFDFLMKTEMFVYIVGEWRQGISQPAHGGTRSVGTDLNQLYELFFEFVDLKTHFDGLSAIFAKYGFIFSIRVLTLYVAIKSILINRDRFHTQVVSPYEERSQLIENIRYILLNDLGELLESAPELLKKGYGSLNRCNYIKSMLIVKNKNSIVQATLTSQQAQSKKAYRSYINYWSEHKGFDGTHIFIGFKVKCSNFVENFGAIDSEVRNAIDLLKKSEGSKIYAYLGHWCVFQNVDIGEREYQFKILFSLDTHYVEYDQSSEILGHTFKQKYFSKLEAVFDRYNQNCEDDIAKVGIQEIPTQWEIINFNNLQPVKETTNEMVYKWFYEVSHRFQYFTLTPISQKKVVKGIKVYKKRK